MTYELRDEETRIDPEKMRDYARALKADARDLTDVATGMRTAVVSMDFGGPAADRFHNRVRSRIKDLREYADRLGDVARIVLEEAEEIERARRRAAT